jgi:ATP-dependent Clp endopeptidase proteolytic subunit ClpP
MKSAQRDWFRVEAKDDSADSRIEVFLYDELFDTGCEMFGGICPAPFIEALTPYRNREITVRINSPGGSIFAGITLYNYLKSFPKLSTVVDGLAASAASVVMLAPPKERRQMAQSAFIMVHEPSGLAWGPPEVMEKMAAELRKMSDSTVQVYANSTGASVDQVKKWLAAETWFTGDEALDAGFVGSLTDAPAIEAKFDLSHFRRVPGKLSNRISQITMSTTATGGTAAPITACGCGGAPAAPKANNTDELDALKKENADLKSELEKLKGEAATAKKARAVAAVDASIADGRLQPALREVMISQYERDEPATVKSLSELPRVTAGAAPIPRGASSATGKSLKDIIDAEPDHKKRLSMRVANWDALVAAG